MIGKFQTLLTIFLLMIYLGCTDKNKNYTNEENHSLKSDSGAFIAYTIYVDPKKEEQFYSQLKSNYLPIWQKLKNDSLVSELSVFKLKQQDSSKKTQLVCNYLILVHLVQNVRPKKYLEGDKLANYNKADQDSIFKIQRMEILYSTPNAYFPAINTKRNDIVYWIEFIAVKNSADFVNQYHDLIKKYFGPLNGILVNEGKLHSIFMLETAEVLFQRDNRLNWNQLHVSGDFPEFVDLDWDSLYADLFRQTFSRELDSVWELLPPTLKTSFDCTGKLIQDLQLK